MEYVTVAQEGFYGLYHVPDKDHDPKKVVIVVGGSEGNENIPIECGCYVCQVRHRRVRYLLLGT